MLIEYTWSMEILVEVLPLWLDFTQRLPLDRFLRALFGHWATAGLTLATERFNYFAFIYSTYASS